MPTTTRQRNLDMINKRIENERRYQDIMEEQKQIHQLRTITEWGSRQAVRKPTAFVTREKQEMADEVRYGNAELKSIRHRKLKRFYDESYKEWSQKLSSRGLSLSSGEI